MRLREFIAVHGGAAAWPLTAGAQQTKVWRVGYLSPAFPPDKSPGDAAVFEAFRGKMNDLGYVEGKNLIIEVRYAEGQSDRLPALANELVSLPCDLIVAFATPAIAAAQRATSTIPIVMSPSTDPIGSGFIKSFAHPAGNITGVANLYGDMTAKTVELLHAILPGAKKIAVLMSSNPTHPPLYDVIRAPTRLTEKVPLKKWQMRNAMLCLYSRTLCHRGRLCLWRPRINSLQSIRLVCLSKPAEWRAMVRMRKPCSPKPLNMLTKFSKVPIPLTYQSSSRRDLNLC